MYAGLKLASGDIVVTMDVDLQDPPDLLPQMWDILHTPEKEYDCVATRRTTRKGEPPIRSFFARLFYKLINELSDTEIVDGARDYRMMTRQMVDADIADGEYNRFSKGIFSWVGFRTKWLAYENVERSAGETKWSFWKLFKYSIEGILAYTTVPLYLSSLMGILMCFVSFCVSLRRPCGWLAVYGVYCDATGRAHPACAWDYGVVYCEDLSGNEEEADIYSA